MSIDKVRKMIHDYYLLNKEIDVYLPIIERNCDIIDNIKKLGTEHIPINRILIKKCIDEISKCHSIVFPLLDKSHAVSGNDTYIYNMLECTYLAIRDNEYDKLMLLEKEILNYI